MDIDDGSQWLNKVIFESILKASPVSKSGGWHIKGPIITLAFCYFPLFHLIEWGNSNWISASMWRFWISLAFGFSNFGSPDIKMFDCLTNFVWLV